MIKKIIFKNLIFYWQKVLLAIVLIAFLLFIIFASWLFTNRIKKLADAPLNSLQTEIILQQDKVNKNPDEIKTNGIIEPFDLQSFDKEDAIKKLSFVGKIKNISTALVLWQFDVQNNKTIIALDIDDPLVGMRKIEQLLMPQGKFFSSNNAEEVILERHFARLFGYKLNSTYPIKGKNYKIVGIVDFKEQSNLTNAQVFMPYNTALNLLGEKNYIINQIYISLAKASSLPKVQDEIKKNLPLFSIITKDRLLKNLSSFNRLVYQFGKYFVLGIALLSFLLIFWILKMNRLELGQQTKILQIIGWPKGKVNQWIELETGFILLASLLLGLLFLSIFYWSILPHIKVGILLNQNFKLNL